MTSFQEAEPTRQQSLSGGEAEIDVFALLVLPSEHRIVSITVRVRFEEVK